MDHLVTAACANCGEELAAGAKFCEGCGTPVAAAASEAATSAPGVGAATPPTVKATEPDGLAVAPGELPADGAIDTAITTDPEGDIPLSDIAADPAAQPAPAPELSDTCKACGGTIAADGYCEQCGEPAVRPRDHWSESPAPWVGGVCDRGIRHTKNEDAMALAVDGTVAMLVVCDGVSTAPDSDVASLAAAAAARGVLAAGAPSGTSPITGGTSAKLAAWSTLLLVSAVAANDAISAAVGDSATNAEPPSCTFVGAVVDGPLVVVGWLGDSRAYWIPDAGTPRQLSVDDSWANELMQQGMPRAKAETSKNAHAITRWLGPDAEDVTASTAPTVTHGPGWVLVCSDGLWNYCSAAEDMAGLLQRTIELVGEDPTAISAQLVRWANAQGGRDNITATLARIQTTAAPEASDEFDNLQEERTAPTAPRIR